MFPQQQGQQQPEGVPRLQQQHKHQYQQQLPQHQEQQQLQRVQDEPNSPANVIPKKVNYNSLERPKVEGDNSFDGEMEEEGNLFDTETSKTSDTLMAPKKRPTEDEATSWDPGKS